MTYKLVRNFAACAAFTLVATSAVAQSTGGTGGEDRLTENVSLNGVDGLDRLTANLGLAGGEDRLTENVSLNGGGGDWKWDAVGDGNGFSTPEKFGIAAAAATLFFMLNQGGSTNNTPKR